MNESDIICVWNRVVSDFEIWLRLEKGLMPNSIDAYLHDVAYLSDYAAANSLIPEQITLTDLQNFLNKMLSTTIPSLLQMLMVMQYGSLRWMKTVILFLLILILLM